MVVGMRARTVLVGSSDRRMAAGTGAANSTAMLLCEPPPISHTPSASFVLWILTLGAVAVRTLSGTVRDAFWMLTFTSLAWTSMKFMPRTSG